MLKSKEDAFQLLQSMGASKGLIKHAELVGEAAELIIAKFLELEISLDYDFVGIGAAIHDVGKISLSHEMNGPGSDHERRGEKMLLELGVQSRIARCCMSHARWKDMECSLEELLVALADKLWKGKRDESLESLIIDRTSEIVGRERWEVFEDLDSLFESIADDGDDRLNRSA